MALPSSSDSLTSLFKGLQLPACLHSLPQPSQLHDALHPNSRKTTLLNSTPLSHCVSEHCSSIWFIYNPAFWAALWHTEVGALTRFTINGDLKTTQASARLKLSQLDLLAAFGINQRLLKGNSTQKWALIIVCDMLDIRNLFWHRSRFSVPPEISALIYTRSVMIWCSVFYDTWMEIQYRNIMGLFRAIRYEMIQWPVYMSQCILWLMTHETHAHPTSYVWYSHEVWPETGSQTTTQQSNKLLLFHLLSFIS